MGKIRVNVSVIKSQWDWIIGQFSMTTLFKYVVLLGAHFGC